MATGVFGAPAAAYPPRGRDEQWVDGPAAYGGLALGAASPVSQAAPRPAAAPAAANQNMLFKWVDYPVNAGMPPPPQPQYPYPQAPYAPPYYQGMDPYGVPPRPPGAYGQPAYDPLSQGAYGAAAPYAAAAAGTGMDGSWGRQGGREEAYQPPMQPPGAVGAYGQRPPRALHMDDLSALRAGAKGQGGGWSNDGYGGYGDSRGKGGGKYGYDDGKGRRDKGGRQGDGKGGKGRMAESSSVDQQLQACLESLGSSGVREHLSKALESIYWDRIKPMANYVKGRLKERSVPEPLVKSFLALYEQHTDLFNVQQPQTTDDEACIYFVSEPSWFNGWVDIDSPNDPYDEAMWEEFSKFLDGEHTFAGGRYGMSRELMTRDLAFLKPYSLGEICHIVQLAIQHRKLIVYHRKMLKPIQAIMSQSPSNANKQPGAPGEVEVGDMEQLCMLLFRLLLRHPQGVQLSRMKQMIKHEFGCVISEMAFRCTKLSELFNREPLSGTFKLDTEDSGKAIYVRMGSSAIFTDHVKQLYQAATTAEATG
eukprot:TRINITY_DN35578_c0_g1_i1.p1 TRINITY_DN35578_c0_g1~~TRINITY_DN35578_c0_g1_i1.p1  ORF type:complete len:535 (-),score=106.18 TRINITY_DN35578_c0_g1_i1:127-1731(-)